MPAIFNVVDYGARGDGVTNDQAAFKLAIAAAAQNGGIVYVPAGTFIIGAGGTDESDGAIELLSNVTLQGAGMGTTVLKLMNQVGQQVNGFVRTPYGETTQNVQLLDLTLDGNRANNSTVANAFFCGVAPGSPLTVQDVTVRNVEARNFSGYGFDPHERTVRLTIENSVAHHNALDGFVADFQIDGVFRNNIAYLNDRHGFNIVTSTTNFLLDNNTAYNNGGTGITIQRGSDPTYAFTNHITVQGGSVYNNGRAGIEVKMSNDILITGINIHDNGKEAINLSGANNVSIISNTIANNGLSGSSGYYNSISLVDQFDSYSGQTFTSSGNVIQNNTISSSGAILSSYGIFENSSISAITSFSGNLIDGMKRGDVLIDGQLYDQSGAAIGANGVYDVKLFGAVGNGVANDTAAIQSAIDAAYAAGGGIVYIGAGTYKVSGTSDKSDGALRLLDNVTLQGAGMGLTIIKVQDANPYAITGIVRTPFNQITHDVAMYDLTLDGNRANNTMKIDGFYTGVAPGSTRQDYNITVARVEIMNCSGYGFDPHEQTRNLRIADSVAHHNGLDGFVADFLVNSVFENNLAYANDRHGFNVTTSTTDLLLLNNTAHDNGSAGVVIQRGSENIPLPNNIRIEGGDYYNNAREGIYVKMADDVTITGVDVYGNKRQGIRLDGVDNALVTGSNVGNNSQEGASLYDEIRINRFNDTAGSSGLIFDSTGIRIESSTIYSNLAIKARYGIYEATDVTGINSLLSNTISGQLSGPSFFVPQLVTPVPDQTGNVGTAFNYQLPANTFFDADQANPALSATQANGAALPAWLTFNPATRQFSGNPTSGGTFQITVKATDAGGLNTTDTFNLVVAGGGSNPDIYGTSGADTLTGSNGNDNIYGLGGNDILRGLDGADMLDGGSGSDTMEGGAGDDIYIVNTSTDIVTEAAGAGTDTIRSTNSRTLDANVENGTLLGTSAINSTGNALANTLIGNSGVNILTGNAGDDRLYGGGGDDTLRGGTGNDILDGETGADRMEGGDGNDLFTVDNIADTIVEYVNSGAGGIDTVRSTVSFTLATNVENLTLLGTNIINGTGNSAANILTGNGSANVLDGGAGNDTLQGDFGDDRLIGGTGNDSLDGGSGQDRAVFAGAVGSYTITTSAGSISIRDNDSVTDGNDGTDTLVGVETAEFKGGATVSLAAPIILDLDGNGIALIDLADSNARFDFNGDGRAARTGWISQGDAFLFLDRDGDGSVSNAAEISFVTDKPGARSDLDGLSAFDSNGDGFLSSADDSFASFKLWTDSNGDGHSDAGELKSLADAGIASLSLTGIATERDWAWDENIVVNSGSFVRTDGSTGALADVALRHDDPAALAQVHVGSFAWAGLSTGLWNYDWSL